MKITKIKTRIELKHLLVSKISSTMRQDYNIRSADAFDIYFEVEYETCCALDRVIHELSI